MAMRYEDDFEQQRRLRYAQRPEQYDYKAQLNAPKQHIAKRFSVQQADQGMWVLREHFSNGQSRVIGNAPDYQLIKEVLRRKEQAVGDTILLDLGVAPHIFYNQKSDNKRQNRFYVKENGPNEWDVLERFSSGAPDYLRARFSSRNAAIQSRESYEESFGKWLGEWPEPCETSSNEPPETSNPRRSLQMNHSLAVFLVAPERVRAVKCSYDLDADDKPIKTYTFKTVLSDLALKDIVIVPTGTRVGFTCVRVEELDIELDLNSTIEYKWIVAKLDRSEYDKVQAMERSMIDKIKRSEVRKARKAVADALFEDQEELRLQLEAEAKVIGHETAPPAAAADQANKG